MKSFRYVLFPLLTIGFAIGFGGCGEDALITSPEKDPPEANNVDNQAPKGATAQGNGSKAPVPLVVEDDQAEVSNAIAPVTNPGPKWSGASGEFASVFGGRAFPGELPRLFVNATAAPYTGSIKRVFSNGEPQFTGDYENGYLEGTARWWNSDGSLASVAQMKEGKVVKWELVGQIEDNRGQPEIASTEPAFAGTYDNIDEWTTGFNASEGTFLLDKKSGEKVSGGVKVHDENRRIRSYTGYKDGLKHGPEAWWNENGVKVYEATFVNGKKHGLETSWNDDGSTATLDLYDNGKLVENAQE